MSSEYPYMISNNKIGPILEQIKAAAKPSRFSNQFLKNLGFSSSNDRAIIPLFRKLEFITESGTPTTYYDRLKDPTDHPYVLGERIKNLYSEIYTINTNIHNSPDDIIKGAFSRTTGKDEKTVNRYFATFKSLCSLAKFDSNNQILSRLNDDKVVNEQKTPDTTPSPIVIKPNPDFHYNIQIHLPATTDISVYNMIFKSLKENLLI